MILLRSVRRMNRVTQFLQRAWTDNVSLHFWLSRLQRDLHHRQRPFMLNILKMSFMAWFSKFVVIIAVVAIGATPSFALEDFHHPGLAPECCGPDCGMMAVIKVEKTECTGESKTEMRLCCEGSNSSIPLTAITRKTAQSANPGVQSHDHLHDWLPTRSAAITSAKPSNIATSRSLRASFCSFIC